MITTIIILSILLVVMTGVAIWLMIRTRREVDALDQSNPQWTRIDEQMLKLMEAGNLVLSQYEADGHLKYISPEIKRITGISSADFISGKHRMTDLVHPEDKDALVRLENARSDGSLETKSIDCRIQDQRGKWHWLHIHQRNIEKADAGKGYETLAIDYTALAELESQKMRSGELQSLTTNILDSFLATDDTRATLNRNLAMIGRHLMISEATIHEFESDEECLLIGSWTSSEHDPSALTERALSGEEASDVRTLLEGLTPVRFGGKTSRSNRGIEALCNDPANRLGVIVPVRVIGKLALVLTFSRTAHQPWNSDEISALQLIAQSLSRRLEREMAVQERNTFDEIRRGHERSEIIAHLASGIAHDFNNIVFAISGRIQLLQRRSEDTKTNESLAEIQTTLQGAKGIIGALLAMHKGTARPIGRVRIGPEVKAMLTMIRRLIPRRIELTLDIQNIGNIEAELSAESLHQILMNLVINARDAINNKGRIALTMTTVTSENGDPLISIDIDDDGPGIPDSMRAEVFQPFVTSKSSSRGTGLGLSIVQRVIKEYGGNISLQDSPLGGLRAHIELRIASGGDLEATPVKSGLERPAPPTETRLKNVLIVEDDETIKALLTRFFDSIGVAVTSLGDAREVEASIRETTPPYDAIVMDIDLPYKTGIECLKEIRGQGLQTPCVLITGGLSEEPVGISNMGFLRKPFEIDDLETLCTKLVRQRRGM